MLWARVGEEVEKFKIKEINKIRKIRIFWAIYLILGFSYYIKQEI